MTDLDPRIWDNPTLGAAANGVFLDVVEAQQIENRRAEIEGREPLIAIRDDRYPGFPSHDHIKGMVESITDVRLVEPGGEFKDGEVVTISQAGPQVMPKLPKAVEPKVEPEPVAKTDPKK